MKSADFEQLEFELWLDQRFDSTITLGVTTLESRKQKAREVLLFEDRSAIKLKSRLSGKMETLGNVFGRIYGEALVEKHENGDGL